MFAATEKDRSDGLDRCLGLAVKYVVISNSVLKESIALNFALYFAKINILNEKCK